jgi:cephalosporin hydroxylase
MAPEDRAVDFTLTALITQFGDDEANFQEEYDNGHPDNYNHDETVEDDSGSDTEQLEGYVMYNKTGEKSD